MNQPSLLCPIILWKNDGVYKSTQHAYTVETHTVKPVLIEHACKQKLLISFIWEYNHNIHGILQQEKTYTSTVIWAVLTRHRTNTAVGFVESGCVSVRREICCCNGQREVIIITSLFYKCYINYIVTIYNTECTQSKNSFTFIHPCKTIFLAWFKWSWFIGPWQDQQCTFKFNFYLCLWNSLLC